MSQNRVFQAGELLRFFYNHADRQDGDVPPITLKRPISEVEVIDIFCEIKKDRSIEPHLVERKVIDHLVANNYGLPHFVEHEVVGYESD